MDWFFRHWGGNFTYASDCHLAVVFHARTQNLLKCELLFKLRLWYGYPTDRSQDVVPGEQEQPCDLHAPEHKQMFQVPLLFFNPVSLPLFCASATGKPPLRCNSERDATARKYLELNHPLPTHGLLTCIGPYWENMQSLPNKSCQPCQPCYFLETQGQAKISLQRTTGNCVARRFTPELITCKSVNLYMQHPADFALEVCLYGAGFPCTPFSLLHWGSQLLQEQEARQMYRVLDNIKDCQPAATCSM